MDEGKRESVHFDDEIFLRGDTYYYRGTPEGTKNQIERSLKIKKGAAQKDVLRAKKAVVESVGNIGSRAGKNSFSALSSLYIESRKEEAKDPEILSHHSYQEAESIIRLHLVPYFGNKRIDELEPVDFADYCILKRKNGLNLVNHRKVMNHFMKWCQHESYIKYRIQFEIPKKAQKARRSRVVLTNVEVKNLTQAVMDLAETAPHFRKTRLYVMLYLFMGMRNMEICKLRWDEVNLTEGSLKINKWNNRRRKERPVPINSYCLEILKEEFERKSSDWVFPSATNTAKKPYMDPAGSYRKGWQKALETAGIERHITPHDLRATFETFMHLNKGLTDSQREKMAGASIDVQKNIYVTMDVEHLRGAEESVNLPEIQKIFRAKARAKEDKKTPAKLVTKRKNKGK